MKITENENYRQYLKFRLIDFFSQKTNYIYGGLIILTFGFFWNRDGLSPTLRLFTTMTNGIIIALFLTEGLLTLMYKELRRNRYFTYTLTIGTLTTFNIIFYDIEYLFWSLVTCFVFFISIVTGLTFNKIKLWKR
jgi:hypothetical protein